MSYILDALKKSERERAGTVDALVSDAPPARPHVWPRQVWPLALASGLVAGAVVAVIMIWRAPALDTDTTTRAVSVSPAAVALPLSPVADLPTVRGFGSAPENTLPAPEARAATPATPNTQAVTSPSVSAPTTRDEPLFLRQKSVEFQRQLPELTVTIHVYSPEESQRILFINNREYRRGDRVQDGLRVEEIVPEGALLSYRGELFKLRRPY